MESAKYRHFRAASQSCRRRGRRRSVPANVGRRRVAERVGRTREHWRGERTGSCAVPSAGRRRRRPTAARAATRRSGPATPHVVAWPAAELDAERPPPLAHRLLGARDRRRCSSGARTHRPALALALPTPAPVADSCNRATDSRPKSGRAIATVALSGHAAQTRLSGPGRPGWASGARRSVAGTGATRPGGGSEPVSGRSARPAWPPSTRSSAVRRRDCRRVELGVHLVAQLVQPAHLGPGVGDELAARLAAGVGHGRAGVGLGRRFCSACSLGAAGAPHPQGDLEVLVGQLAVRRGLGVEPARSAAASASRPARARCLGLGRSRSSSARVRASACGQRRSRPRRGGPRPRRCGAGTPRRPRPCGRWPRRAAARPRPARRRGCGRRCRRPRCGSARPAALGLGPQPRRLGPGAVEDLPDALVDVVGGDRARWPPRSCRRSDSIWACALASWAARSALRAAGGVALGGGDAQVVVEPADLAVDLLAVVAAHRGVETAARLVERQVGRSRLAHAHAIVPLHAAVDRPSGVTRGSTASRKRLIASRCLARSSGSRTPSPSSGARHSTPTLPWCRLRCTS